MCYLWALQLHKTEYWISIPYHENYTTLNWGVCQGNVNFTQNVPRDQQSYQRSKKSKKLVFDFFHKTSGHNYALFMGSLKP